MSFTLDTFTITNHGRKYYITDAFKHFEYSEQYGDSLLFLGKINISEPTL